MRTLIQRVLKPEVDDLWKVTYRDDVMHFQLSDDILDDRALTRRLSSNHLRFISKLENGHIDLSQVRVDGSSSYVCKRTLDDLLRLYSPHISEANLLMFQFKSKVYNFLNHFNVDIFLEVLTEVEL